MENLINDWDGFWKAGYKTIENDIDFHIKSDQAQVTFKLIE